jgi:hypothetical protein
MSSLGFLRRTRRRVNAESWVGCPASEEASTTLQDFLIQNALSRAFWSIPLTWGKLSVEFCANGASNTGSLNHAFTSSEQ